MTTNCCFQKSSRLRKPSEFNTVYQHNQTRVKGQYFIVLAFSHFQVVANAAVSAKIAPRENTARMGVVVSKKVAKSAVKRNRIKRLVREQFRQQKDTRVFDFIVIALPAANQADNRQLTKELNYLWRKLYRRCDTV